MGLDVQQLSTNTYTNITSVFSSGANNDDSTYLGSIEKSPAINDSTMDLPTIIEVVVNIHEVSNEGLSELNLPNMIFTLGQELNPGELVGIEAIQIESVLEDDETPLLLTQTPSQSSPPVDNSNTLYSPPPRLRKSASDSTCLAVKGDLPRDLPTNADDMFFGVYRDRLHQNTITHLDGGIE